MRFSSSPIVKAVTIIKPVTTKVSARNSPVKELMPSRRKVSISPNIIKIVIICHILQIFRHCNPDL